MNVEETVKAVYRIWKRPGKAEYKYILYRGSEIVAQFKAEDDAKVAMLALTNHHLMELYRRIQK